MTTRSPAERTKRRVPRWRAVGPLVAVLVAVAALAAACGGGGSHHAASSSSNGAIVHSSNGTSASSSARQSGVLYTDCMRSHGITDFPDPLPGGGYDLPQGVDFKSNPDWQSAQQACQDDLPGGGPSGKQGNSKVNIPEELTFAACMRAHGITDFPDPNSQGVIQIANPAGILDPDSPQFEAAQNACQAPGSAGIPIAVSANGS
jgi:hypothetical protein